MGRYVIPLIAAMLLNSIESASQLHLKPLNDSTEKMNIRLVMPRNFYIPPVQPYIYNCLGFFCKKERALQQAIRLPLFIRLGSLEFVNRLEKSNRK